ncbi:hypothetical protein DDE82_008886 [Stemphylium lycopersici]|uniref:Uncharacterized protein n=1 Tax=Stemphylium lycopersici TaxID=183478 RepID=A0A364MSH7_STELY|nr:hypothetical protein TW65_09322 [Stemphylium lycopersici]RAQ98814.1 hypothetical protein DDE82_008886 [Stemphylium lycopersici]RAR02101.1 hypothetical protein DDE83_008682 [Stemphylium lycopersici]
MAADRGRTTATGASSRRQRLFDLKSTIRHELKPVYHLAQQLHFGHSKRKECLKEQIAILSSALDMAQPKTPVSSMPSRTTEKETVIGKPKYALPPLLPPILEKEEDGKEESLGDEQQPPVSTEAKKSSNEAQLGGYIVRTTGHGKPYDTTRGSSPLKRKSRRK